MADPSNNCKRINSMLLEESVWQVEDRLNILIQSVADIEAGLIRLKGTTEALEQRLLRLEMARSRHLSEEASNG